MSINPNAKVINITDVSATLSITLTSDYSTAETLDFRVWASLAPSITVFSGTITIPAGSVTGDTVTADITELDPSTDYLLRVNEPPMASATFTTKATGYDTPRAATQEQWEDLVARIKDLAPSNLFDTLYSDSTGTTGTVTLSSSAAGYARMKIFYKDNNDAESCTEVYSPNGKTVYLAVARSSDAIYLKCRNVTISGTSITNAQVPRESALRDQEYPAVTETNNIYVVRVEGWKF